MKFLKLYNAKPKEFEMDTLKMFIAACLVTWALVYAMGASGMFVTQSSASSIHSLTPSHITREVSNVQK